MKQIGTDMMYYETTIPEPKEDYCLAFFFKSFTFAMNKKAIFLRAFSGRSFSELSPELRNISNVLPHRTEAHR